MLSATRVLLEPRVPTEFVALPASALKLPTGGPSHRVNLACIPVRGSAKPHAGAVSPRRKGHLPEVARLNLRRNVIPTEAAPTSKILRGNQNTAVVTGSTTSSASKAIGQRRIHDWQVVRRCSPYRFDWRSSTPIQHHGHQAQRGHPGLGTGSAAGSSPRRLSDARRAETVSPGSAAQGDRCARRKHCRACAICFAGWD